MPVGATALPCSLYAVAHCGTRGIIYTSHTAAVSLLARTLLLNGGCLAIASVLCVTCIDVRMLGCLQQRHRPTIHVPHRAAHAAYRGGRRANSLYLLNLRYALFSFQCIGVC